MTEGRPPAGDGGMTTVPRSVAKPGTPPAGFEPNFKPGSEYDHTRPRRDKPVQLTYDEAKPFIDQYNDIVLQSHEDLGFGLLYDLVKGVTDKTPNIPSFLPPRTPGRGKPSKPPVDDGFDPWSGRPGDLFGYPEYDRRNDPYSVGGPKAVDEPPLPFHPGWNGTHGYVLPDRNLKPGEMTTPTRRKPSGPPSGSR